jgi:VWFA-related protein
MLSLDIRAIAPAGVPTNMYQSHSIPRAPVRRLRRAAGLVLAGVILATGPAPGAVQTPAPQTQGQTFRARIDSIAVDVIVQDDKGVPVADLTADDFEIREAGTVQRIDTFKFIDVDAIDANRPTTHRDILSFEDQRREAARDDTRVLVILLDDYHVRRGNSLRVREQLAEFISRLSSNDLVAITYPLASTAGLTFSRNHDAMARAAMDFEGRKYDYTPRNAYEERYQMQPPEALERMRNDITLRALESIGAYMGSLRDGRKTLLFVSEGLSGTLPAGVNTSGSPYSGRTGAAGSANDSVAFFNSTEIMSQMRYVFAAANRANTSIYTLDPRGLAVSEYDIDDNVTGATDRRTLSESLDTLRSIAGETGGRAIVNRNNPGPELQQMIMDSSAYYLLAYTTSEAPRDGKFHEIQVTVKRPGVQVRARKGYWAYTEEEAERALAPPRPEAPADVRNALGTLATAAGPVGARRITVWTGSTPRGPGQPSDVTFAWEAVDQIGQAASRDAVARVSVVAETPDGTVVFRGAAPAADGRIRRGGRVTFAAPHGDLRLRIVVEDEAGQRLDADDLAFDVADYLSATLLVVSPPAVFRGRTARDIQTIRAAEAPVPTAQREFSRTERLLLTFGVYGGGGAADPDVTLRLLNHEGASMASYPAPTRRPDGRYEAVVALGPLPPGDFLIEISAKAGEASTRSLLAIRVTG